MGRDNAVWNIEKDSETKISIRRVPLLRNQSEVQVNHDTPEEKHTYDDTVELRNILYTECRQNACEAKYGETYTKDIGQFEADFQAQAKLDAQQQLLEQERAAEAAAEEKRQKDDAEAEKAERKRKAKEAKTKAKTERQERERKAKEAKKKKKKKKKKKEKKKKKKKKKK